MTWQENAIMYWSDDDGTTWHKITDHNRAPLSIGVTRLGTDNRMTNGRLRRYSVAKKRSFSTSWDNIPAITAPATGGMAPVDAGYGGKDIKDWHDTHDGSFLVRLRKGQDIAKAITDSTIEEVEVMITDFSSEVNKRGIHQDLWNVSITLEEV